MEDIYWVAGNSTLPRVSVPYSIIVLCQQAQSTLKFPPFILLGVKRMMKYYFFVSRITTLLKSISEVSLNAKVNSEV